MNCGISFVKYLFFIFNLIFTVVGLLILGVGIWALSSYGGMSAIERLLWWAMISLTVLGVMTFVIAFSGCCGAIRENRCMIIAFAVFLLIALIAQTTGIILVFTLGKNTEMQTIIKHSQQVYKNTFQKYSNETDNQKIIDSFQSTFSCCGMNSFHDFEEIPFNNIPWSCCGNLEVTNCTESKVYKSGCVTVLTSALKILTEIFGGITIGISVIELIGITLAFILANSLSKDQQKGYGF